MVKIFDVSNLSERPVDGTFDLEAYERGIEEKLVANHGKVPFMQGEDDQDEQDGEMVDDAEESKEPAAGKDNENDWSDADDSDDSDDDDSDDSDMSDDRRHKPKDLKLNPKANTVGLSKKMLQKEKAKDFFKDM